MPQQASSSPVFSACALGLFLAGASACVHAGDNGAYPGWNFGGFGSAGAVHASTWDTALAARQAQQNLIGCRTCH